MEVGLMERYKGALVGVHAGDAIGAPYETWKPKRIAEDIEARGGLTFFDYENPWPKDIGDRMLPAGRPTDDSDQTADLAWSLIECDEVNPGHLRECLRDSVVRSQSRLWSGLATGACGTTRKALSDNPLRVEAARQNNIGTNGSLMRSAPMALWMHSCNRVPRYDFNQVAVMSSVTHCHPHSISACLAYTAIMLAILEGKDIESSLSMMEMRFGRDHRLVTRVALQLRDPDCYPYDPGDWPGRGAAEFSLYAALWCFKHATSFRDGIERAVRIGGDTDTYAAIAGGLLGAYYGYEGIPKEWRNTILGHDVMVEYAQTLLCGVVQLQS